MARNGLYGDSNHRIDTRISRTFRVRESVSIELIGEVANLTNRANYNGYNNTAFQAVATTVATPLAQPVLLNTDPSFLRVNNNGAPPDGTGARRFQLALRLRY